MACAIDLDEFLNCEICFEVFDNPQSLTCRHVFCGTCVDRIKHGTKIECPVCKVHSHVKDIKPDYRTVSMVDSYRKNLTKDPSATEASKCETCENNSVKVSHKCETCDLLLCDKCEASHKDSGTDGDYHTTKAIEAIARDTRTEINKALQDLKTQEDVLASKLSNRQKELDDIRETSDNALTSIREKEEKLHANIKLHHDNLRKDVEKEKNKHIANIKQEYKITEGCYHDVRDKQATLASWVNDRADLSIANTTERIQKQLQDIENPSNKSQKKNATSAEYFTIKVIEDNRYDTKLIFSGNQHMYGKEIMKDGAAGPVLIDNTTAICTDYIEEESVEIGDGYEYYQGIDNIQRYNNHLYCMDETSIHVYTEDLAYVKTITLIHHGYDELGDYLCCIAFVCVDDKYLITASASRNHGLTVLDTDGKFIQRICPGQFHKLAIHNHKLYAYEFNINKVLVFEQTLDYNWKQSGVMRLNYDNNERKEYEHDEYHITSFHMKNDQIYIADFTSIYHLDINGNLKRKISHGKNNRAFENPRICSIDSKGNLLVAEHKSKLTVVRADGKCDELLLIARGEGDSGRISAAFMGDDNECLWVTNIVEYGDTLACLTKYIANRSQSV